MHILIWFTQLRHQGTKLVRFLDRFVDSLCTDVPPPSEKKISSPDFFLREGGRLYTGYFVDQEMRLAINFDGRSNLQRTLKQFKIITKIEIK